MPSIRKLALGYQFDRHREVVALIFINYFCIILFSLVLILLYGTGEEMLPVSYRYHSIILISLIQLWLIRKGWITLARILILTLTPFLILILPPLAGLFDNEFYFWYPYVPIAMSLIPHFILHPVRHRTALIVVLVAYYLLGLGIDNLLIYLSDGNETIIPLVRENQFYYNLIPSIIYVFVNVAIGLLLLTNFRYQEIMQKQQQELAQAERMASLGTLATGMAHEINNPLNFISGSLNALNTLKSEYVKLEEGITPEKTNLLKQMDQIMESSFEGVKRASDIISSLRFFASPGKTKRNVTDLEQICDSVLLSIKSKIPDHIHVEKSIPPGLKVFCYEETLQQVFFHILDNAIDAIESKEQKENEHISISATKETVDHLATARITISNTGPPISEKEIGHILDPFFTSKEAGRGKGLGLTISYMIIREHDGKIEIRNEQDGVVVEVLLPLISPSQGFQDRLF